MSNQNDETPELATIVLPEPSKKGEISLLEALQIRRTERNISSKEIPIHILSNLLWAAFGVNRDQASFRKVGRTAPSASNSQEIDLYVLLKKGVYLYDAEHHQLEPVLAGDHRKLSGRQYAAQMTGGTPLNIIYIANLFSYDLGPDQPDPHIGDPEVQTSYYYTDTGFIAQNVYLYAASEGLAAWFHNCDKDIIAKELNLSDNQLVLFAQTIGYPEQETPQC